MIIGSKQYGKDDFVKFPLRSVLCIGAAALMVVAMAGCKGGGGNSATGSVGSTDVTIKKQDLNGYEFKVMDFNSGRWDRNVNNPTPFNKATQDMLDNTEKYLNCKITPMTSVGPGDIITGAQPAIMAGDKYADLIVTTQWAWGSFMGAGLVGDLNTMKCNWDAPWWNPNIRDISTVNGKTYAANGSFIFDAGLTWMIYYNQTIWNQLNLPDPYELVNSGKWTIDLFAQYAKMATQDLNNDGKMDLDNDQWGLVAPDGDFCQASFLAGGIHYLSGQDGKVQLADGNQKTYDFITKMRNMIKVDKSMFIGQAPASYNTGASGFWYANAFIAGKSLFMGCSPGMDGLTDMVDDWGAMPMPKATADQPDYLSGVDHNASVCGITITNTDLDKDALIMDALGYFGQSLQSIYWPDYKETYWRHEATDADIVAKYIAGHGQYDIAPLMSNVQSSFSQPMGYVYNAIFGGNSDFPSVVKSTSDKINADVQAYFSGVTATTAAAVTTAAGS